jgi:regulator of replication initiation timing
LHKALDQRHDAVIQRFAKARGSQELSVLWEDALRVGEVPGAYWAMLTHRGVTSDLRQKAFGDVHMLSHLVGSANRADIRRLVALEQENADLRERLERQQLRSQELVEERDQTIVRLRQELAGAEGATARALAESARQEPSGADMATAMAQVALQTERRERAEQTASVAAEEVSRLRDEVEHLDSHVQTLSRELSAAETQLREVGEGADGAGHALSQQLQGKRVCYVGGRPSSTPAIRNLVLRHGGEFQHHDGGLEDRKGLLASNVAWAELVVFPVDCIDHDSAGNLKRLCARQGVTYMPLRGASVASFAAALSSAPSNDAGSDPRRPSGPGCLKHG